MRVYKKVENTQRFDLSQESKWIIDEKWFYSNSCKSNHLIFFDLYIDFLVYWTGELIYIRSNRDIAQLK